MAAIAAAALVVTTVLLGAILFGVGLIGMVVQLLVTGGIFYLAGYLGKAKLIAFFAGKGQKLEEGSAGVTEKEKLDNKGSEVSAQQKPTPTAPAPAAKANAAPAAKAEPAAGASEESSSDNGAPVVAEAEAPAVDDGEAVETTAAADGDAQKESSQEDQLETEQK